MKARMDISRPPERDELNLIRRPDRSRAKRGVAEGPSLYDLRLVVETRSLRSASLRSGRRGESNKNHRALDVRRGCFQREIAERRLSSRASLGMTAASQPASLQVFGPGGFTCSNVLMMTFCILPSLSSTRRT